MIETAGFPDPGNEIIGMMMRLILTQPIGEALPVLCRAPVR